MTGAGPVMEVARAAMGTVFAVQLSDPRSILTAPLLDIHARQALALAPDVERVCSRFDATSELSQLCATVHTPVAASPLLFELVALALAVAESSDGAFDPTVGRAMAAAGFDRAWESGEKRPLPAPSSATWRDVQLDRHAHTITLSAPLTLDLGAIAKGFAVDLITTAVDSALTCSIHAGGDVRCRGPHPDTRAWRIGIRDPLQTDALVATAHITDGAVCTSGGYERPSSTGGHHLLDPRTGEVARGYASVSVAAPTAVIADGLATAAFILGPSVAPHWLDSHGVDALLVSDDHRVEIVAGAGTTRWELHA